MGDYKQEMRDFIIAHKQDIDSMQIDKVAKAYIDQFINPMPLIALFSDANVNIELSPFVIIMNFLCSFAFDDESAYAIRHYDEDRFTIWYRTHDCAFHIAAHVSNPKFSVHNYRDSKNYSFYSLDDLIKGMQEIDWWN